MATPHSDPSLSTKRLEGKVAIVTGGASGIGAAAVRLFVAHGVFVFIADIQDTLGAALAQELAPTAAFVHCDVSQEKDVQAVVDTAVGQHGRLDIMYSNAGVMGPVGNAIQELDIARMDAVYAVNVRGAVLCTKHAARAMIPAKQGVILATASVASVLGGLGPLPYTITKTALTGWCRAAAMELGQHGIRVNCISPTGVMTPMVNVYLKPDLNAAETDSILANMTVLEGAKVLPRDIANAALFLASDDATCISGHNLLVDGAFTATKGGAIPLHFLRAAP